MPRHLLGAMALFVILLVPVSGLIPFEFQNISTVSDHYLYLALVVPSFGVAYFFRHVPQTRTFVWVAVVLCAVRTSFQVPYWKNSETLFTYILKHNPQSYLARNNLGIYFHKRGRYEEAIPQFQEVARLYPQMPQLYSNLGSALAVTGRLEEAFRSFEESLRQSPRSVAVLYNLGRLHYELGRLEDAEAYLKRALHENAAFQPSAELLREIQQRRAQRDG